MGKIALIPFIGFFLYCYTACMLITAVFINLYLLPKAPTWILLLFMIIPVCYASFKGAGTIGRLATFIVPFTIFTIILFFLFGINRMDLNILKPVLVDSTFFELNKGAFLTAARYSEILIFFVFSYFLKQETSINKTYIMALIIFAISFMLILIPIVTVLGLKFAQHAWNPYYVYTRQIKALEFLERVHALNMLAWYPTALLKLTMYNYMASYVYSRVVKAKDHKYYVIPFSIIAFILCLLPIMNKSSTVELLRSDQVFPWIILPVIFVIPLILVFVYFIRKKKIDEVLFNNSKE